MADVFANSRSILHKGDGLQQVAGPPDVCKTPSPGGPVPIPYPNIAMDSDLAKGTKKVKINGESVATDAANLSTSTGDEAGTAGGGIASSKTKGKLTWGGSSSDVKAEGNGVVRLADPTQHNGNIWNTVLINAGNPAGFGYGDDPVDQKSCSICRKSKKSHRIEADRNVMEQINQLAQALRGTTFQAALRRAGKKGVMIGVLVCQCTTRQAYAGISGNQCGNEFTQLVPSPLIPVVGSPTPPPLTGQSGSLPFQAISNRKWNQVTARVAATQQRHGNSPPVLVCAAPKMVQRCLGDGHKPGKMIEIWIATKKTKLGTVPIRWRRTIVRDPRDPTGASTTIADLGPTEFNDGDPVPSCTTCQVVLTVMLCRLGQPPCP